MVIFIMNNLIFFTTSDYNIVGFLQGVTKKVFHTSFKLPYTKIFNINTMLIEQGGVCILTDFQQVKHKIYINKKLQNKLFEIVPIKGD